jgi:dTMP kinase
LGRLCAAFFICFLASVFRRVLGGAFYLAQLVLRCAGNFKSTCFFSCEMLITFEGIDASGKSTQIRLLKHFLHGKGVEAQALREPGGVILSEQIRNMLLESKSDMDSTTELLLFSASRAELVKKLLLPALANGQIILLDRFYDSTTAYQGYGRGIELNTIHSVNRIAANGIEPNLTIYLDLLPEDAMIRKFSEKSLPLSFGENETPLDRMERSGLDFYHRVREGYKTLVQENPRRFVEIDALKSIQDIHKEILSVVQSRLRLF